MGDTNVFLVSIIMANLELSILQIIMVEIRDKALHFNTYNTVFEEFISLHDKCSKLIFLADGDCGHGIYERLEKPYFQA